MLTIAYYFLQVVLCSGLMMGYYLLVLRNKRFHQYNRFYLLAVAVLSWIVPLIKIRWNNPVINPDAQMMHLLALLANSNSQLEAQVAKQGFQWSWEATVTAIYVLVSAVLLTGVLVALVKVYRLLKQHSCKNLDDVYLVLTNAKGTPFSFFRFIFWNVEIDPSTAAGQQILKHELAHVRQRHSIDKIFIQLMLVAGWFNPFFWLIKREMEMIHEFIADNKAVENGDTASLAQMLLTAAYPQQRFGLTHPFFFSPIRRRLKMLTDNSNPRFSYMRRAIVLPLLAVVVILFSFRNKEQRNNNTLSMASVIEDVIDVANEQPIIQKAAQLVGKAAETLSFNEVSKRQKMEVILADTGILKKNDVNGNNINNPAKVNVLAGYKKAIDSPLNQPLIIIDKERKRDIILSGIDPNSIRSIDVLKDKAAIDYYGPEAANGVILITTKDYYAKHNFSDLLVIVDGARYNYSLDSLNVSEISSVTVLKSVTGYEKYGIDAKNGVIEIYTKKWQAQQVDPAKDLLKKLPGVVVTDTGINVNGEKVKKVFIDGKEYIKPDSVIIKDHSVTIGSAKLSGYVRMVLRDNGKWEMVNADSLTISAPKAKLDPDKNKLEPK